MGTFTLFVNNRPYCDGMKVPPLLFSTLRNYSRVHSYHIFFSFKKFCSLRILYTYIMKYEHIHLSFPSFQLSSKCHLNSIFFSSFFFFFKTNPSLLSAPDMCMDVEPSTGGSVCYLLTATPPKTVSLTQQQ